MYFDNFVQICKLQLFAMIFVTRMAAVQGNFTRKKYSEFPVRRVSRAAASNRQRSSNRQRATG